MKIDDKWIDLWIIQLLTGEFSEVIISVEYIFQSMMLEILFPTSIRNLIYIEF